MGSNIHLLLCHRKINCLVSLLLLVWCVNGLSLAAQAQVTSVITTDSSLGTQVVPTDRIFNINGGTIVGTNQFHSFRNFSVGTNDIASFNGPVEITNILSRVTGGLPSNIDGMLRSTIDGANLFLLNPAGVLFGQNASLDLRGSLSVSTADLLQFEDGTAFHSDSSLDGSTDSILLVDPAEAFGFMTSPTTLSFVKKTPAPITVEGSLLTAPAGETVSFVGGGIDIAAGMVSTSGGSIIFSSVPSRSTVNIRNGEQTQGGMKPLGIRSDQITVSDGARVDASGAPGGAIRIRGGRLVLDDAILESSTQGPGTGVGIVVNIAADAVFTNQTELIADVGDGPGTAGLIKISGDLIEVNQESLVRSQSSSDSSGRTADIEITAGTLSLLEGGQVVSRIQGSGSGGAITISVDNDLVMRGRPGSIDPNFSNPESPKQSRISSTTSFGSSGPGGTLTVTAGNVRMNAARLDAGGFGSGAGGNASVTVRDTLEIRNRSEIATKADLPGITGGSSGTLTVEARDILVVGIKDPADGGNTDFTGFTSATGNGPGGDFHLIAKNLTMRDTGLISSATVGSGDGGNVNIQLSGILDFANGSAIVGSTFGVATGNAGSIEVVADEIVLSGSNPVPIPDIVNPNIAFLNVGSIVNSSLPGPGGGNAGDVQVKARSINLKDGGRIDSRTFSSGNGGAVDVTADEINISDVNPDIIDFFLDSGATLDFSRDLARSSITTDSLSVYNRVEGNEGNPALGKAGDITVRAKDLRIQDGGVISSRTTSPGSGGTILVMADEIAMLNDGQIAASNGLGFFGDSQASTGNTGQIQITTGKNFSLNNSEVRVDAVNGTAGNLSINVGQDLRLTESSLITAESLGARNAGVISLEAKNSIVLEKSTIKTLASQADGGDIKLTATDIIQLTDSLVTSSVEDGKGGNINLDPDFIILQNSQILAKAGAGQGGNISLVANNAVLVDPFSTLDASSALGVSGSVAIQAPIQNLSGTIAPLPEDTLPVTALYGARCAAGRGGHFSTFVDSKIDSLSPTPGEFLASPLLVSSAQAHNIADSSNTERSPFVLTASLAPLMLSKAGEPTTTCP